MHSYEEMMNTNLMTIMRLEHPIFQASIAQFQAFAKLQGKTLHVSWITLTTAINLLIDHSLIDHSLIDHSLIDHSLINRHDEPYCLKKSINE